MYHVLVTGYVVLYYHVVCLKYTIVQWLDLRAGVMILDFLTLTVVVTVMRWVLCLDDPSITL